MALFETAVTALAALAGALLRHDPERYFREGRIVTWISVLQLWLVAAVCWRLYRARRAQLPAAPGWRSPALLWALIAAGFVFLGIDEGATVHENLDLQIHRMLDSTPGQLSDRLDDLIVAMYGLVGVIVLYAWRRELNGPGMDLAVLRYGFYCLVLTVALDFLGNKPHELHTLTGDWNTVYWLRPAVGVVEEWAKLLGEGLFLVAFYLRLVAVRGLPPTASPPATPGTSRSRTR